MAGTGALPQNQIDALPLITPSQAQQAAVVIRSGGQFYKQFSPVETGINLSNFGTFTFGGANSEGLLISNYLDLTFCNRFRLVLLRTISNGTGQAAPTPMTVNLQMRMGPSDNPPPTYSSSIPASLNADFAGRVQASSTAISYPAIQAGVTQRFTVGWGDNEPGDNISGFQFVALGGNCRILISVGAGAVPGALEQYSMWLDAQT